VTAENGGTVSVVDVGTHTVTSTIELPRTREIKPMGVCVSPDGKLVYVATGRGNSLAVIDGVNNRLVTMIPVGNRPWGVAVSPDGRKVYTANGLSNDVSVVDTATNKVIGTIKAGDGPWGITIRP
jgi:YVTN family beta-propeller protein